jgi:predicted DNA-binding transcriptional regulator AlpA
VNSLSNIDSQIQGYLRVSQILSVIPIGRSTWWKWVADGKAPKPIKLGPRTTAWKAEDISQFITQLEEQGGKQ